MRQMAQGYIDLTPKIVTARVLIMDTSVGVRQLTMLTLTLPRSPELQSEY